MDTCITALQSRPDKSSAGLVSAGAAEHSNLPLGDADAGFAQALQAAESRAQPSDRPVLAKPGLAGDGAASGPYAMAKQADKISKNHRVELDYSSPLSGHEAAESLSHMTELGVLLDGGAPPLLPAAGAGTASLGQHHGQLPGELGQFPGQLGNGAVSVALDDETSGQTRFLSGNNAPPVGKTLPLQGLDNATEAASFDKRAIGPAANHLTEQAVTSGASKLAASDLQLPLNAARGQTSAQASATNMPPRDTDTAAGRPLGLRAGTSGEIQPGAFVLQGDQDVMNLNARQNAGIAVPDGGVASRSGAVHRDLAAFDEATTAQAAAKMHDTLSMRGGLSAGRVGMDGALNATAAEVTIAHGLVGDARVTTSSNAVVMDGGHNPASVLPRVLPGVLDMTSSREQIGDQLGGRLISMASDGQKSARIHLHPQELGAIEIRVRMDQSGTSLSINAQHGHAREAIEASLPRLREMFVDQGMNLLDVDVSGGQQEQSARPDERHASLAPRPIEDSKADDAVAESSPAQPAVVRNARRLDVLA